MANPDTPTAGSPQVAGRRSGLRQRTLVISLCLILLILTSIGGFLLIQHSDAESSLVASLARTTGNARRTATAAANNYMTGTNGGVQLGFDAAHTNWNPYERVINARNVTQLVPRWSSSTNGTINTAPTVADGVVYVDSSDGQLYAFDVTCHTTCQPLWSYQISTSLINASDSSPAVANGIVYVGSNGRSGNPYSSGSGDVGTFYAFDATCRRACQPLWTYSTAGLTFSSPTVANGVVYVSSVLYNGPFSQDSKLYAFDATCRNACQPLWLYSTAGVISSPPTVANGLVYVSSTSLGGGSGHDVFYAFDATCRSACQPLWSYPIGGYPYPVVADGMVYVSAGNELYVFDATCRNACRPLWSYSPAGPGYPMLNAPAVADGVVYLSNGMDGVGGGELYAFDGTCRSTCQPLWTYSTADWLSTAPTVANGIVYVVSKPIPGTGGSSKLYAFNASRQGPSKPLWSHSIVNIGFPPFVVNGVLYVGSNVGPGDGPGNGPGSGKLYAFGLPTS